MTLLLHPRDLREECLVVLLHLIDLELELIFLTSVVISTLLHLSELHLGPLNFSRQLLDLPLMSIIVLKLVQLLFKLFNRCSFRVQFTLKNLVFIFKALDLVLKSLHSLHDFSFRICLPARFILGRHWSALVSDRGWTSETSFLRMRLFCH